MLFLIGIIILILFIIFCYFYVRNIFRKYLGTSNLKEIIRDAKLEDFEVPKSLSSMDSVYLEQIRKDFPDMNINELKRESERIILDTFQAIEKGDISIIKVGKIRSFVRKKISENKGKKVRYKNFKIHKTVISKYERKGGIATIYFGSSFEYVYISSYEEYKKQDRAMLEFIYVFDMGEDAHNKKTFSLSCPNCGAPIHDLGKKRCSYCSSYIVDVVKKCWICNDLKLY